MFSTDIFKKKTPATAAAPSNPVATSSELIESHGMEELGDKWTDIPSPNVPAAVAATSSGPASNLSAPGAASASTGSTNNLPGSNNNTAIGTGILTVRIVEARQLNARPNCPGSVLYAVLEFDKNEIAAESQPGDDVSSPKWIQRANFDVSRTADLVVSVYQRLQNAVAPAAPRLATSLVAGSRLPKPRQSVIAPTQETIVLGSGRLTPKFLDQKTEDLWMPLYSSTSQIGEIHLQILFRKLQSKKSLAVDDFDLLTLVGKGSFGKVMQVRKKDTGRIYAMKIIRKANIVERDEVEHTLAERNVLARLQNPFIVNLKYSFQSPDKLYLVLAFVNGGELFHHLQVEGSFSEERAKYYAAELFLALECLHKFNIIYRDLKPENILLDYTGHIALCDFGLCKLNMSKDDKTNTFCGTPEYLAPEVLIGEGYDKAVDWWTFGILLYEMMIGLPPFYSENQNEMYRKIVSDPLRFPDPKTDGIVLSSEAKDILKRLLDRDPKKRLGANSSEEVKKHPFFASIDWDRLSRKQIPAPFRPNVESAADTSNFDTEFTSQNPQDSYHQEAPALSESAQQRFQGFTYIGNENNAMYGSIRPSGGHMDG